jgi:hypothetical protein
MKVRAGIEHALDAIVGRPKLDLEEIADVGNDRIGGGFFQHGCRIGHFRAGVRCVEGSPAQVVAVAREVQSGLPAEISTSYVERQNLTLRMASKRFARLSNGLAKRSTAIWRQDGAHSKSSRECTYRKELDMETLVCTRGRAFPLSRLESRLRCPGCGGRNLVVLYQPPASTIAVRHP